jgi:hypothetical protein
MFAILWSAAILSSAPFSDHKNLWLIVPGKSIGKVHLGTDFATVVTSIGEPDWKQAKEGDAAMGRFWYFWPGSRGTELDIYDIRGEQDSAAHPQNFIRQVRVTSSAFHTKDGLHVGSSLRSISQTDPHLSLTLSTSKIRLYDDVRNGISFEFATSGSSHSAWRCVAIVIHPKNVGVFDEYLRFRKYVSPA